MASLTCFPHQFFVLGVVINFAVSVRGSVHSVEKDSQNGFQREDERLPPIGLLTSDGRRASGLRPGRSS